MIYDSGFKIYDLWFDSSWFKIEDVGLSQTVRQVTHRPDGQHGEVKVLKSFS